ncbi:hypothetical protein [Nonomuraea sp. NPDC049646]|uniref:hypothetical protein n=1 Tax=unclassified Nonomuraea TaxID=2593643 RepID=UPI0037A299EF
MTERSQFGGAEWQRQFQESMADAGRKIGESLAHAGGILAAQGAMAWAYRGDLGQTRQALAGMGPEQLRELSAAASMLAALADEELSSR